MAKIQRQDNDKAGPFLTLPIYLESFFCFKASYRSVEPSL
jgi:hypothetical protein